MIPTLLMIVLASTCGCLGEKADVRPDDVAVYRAVLAQTIRPIAAAQDATGGRGDFPPVYVLDRTVPACKPGEAVANACAPSVSAGWLGEATAWDPVEPVRGYLEPDTREAVAMAFRRTISSQQPVTGPLDEGARLLKRRQWRKRNTASRDPKGGYAAFSRPLYPADGHAFVYATYESAGFRASGWFVFLVRTPDGWQVQSVNRVWTS